MKPIEEIVCCIVDSGCFPALARCMAKATKTTYYCSEFEQEYLNIDRCAIGDGGDEFERLDEYMDPDVLKTIDLFIFPDIGHAGIQRYLQSIGKLVWGSRGSTELELYRTRFLDMLAKVGLPTVHCVRLRGVEALAEHLKRVENKYVKINRYRDNMETWHHIDYLHSRSELQRLALEFGPIDPVFVVQDPIDDEEDSPVIEIGFDGWNIDGDFPESTYQGYEKKNQLYLGSELAYDDLPEAVRYVNEKLSPVLASYGHRGFVATEIRVKNGVAHYIDPTNRMAGQTMEHLLKTCRNLAEVIYQGAAGNLIKPDFSSQFAAEATLHYTGEGGRHGWKTLLVPDSILEDVALYRYCMKDGAYHFPKAKNDEVGVICGNGDTIEAAVEDLKENFAEFGDEPVKIELSGFADLVEEIAKAEKEGVSFSEQDVPGPEIALPSAP